MNNIPTYSFGIGFRMGPLERIRIQNEIETNDDAFGMMIVSKENPEEKENEEDDWLMIKAAPSSSKKGFVIKIATGSLNLEDWNTIIKKEIIILVKNIKSKEKQKEPEVPEMGIEVIKVR